MNHSQQQIADLLSRRGYRASPHPDYGPPDLFTIQAPAAVDPSRSGVAWRVEGVPPVPVVCVRMIHGSGGIRDWHWLAGDGSRVLVRNVEQLAALIESLRQVRLGPGK